MTETQTEAQLSPNRIPSFRTNRERWEEWSRATNSSKSLSPDRQSMPPRLRRVASSRPHSQRGVKNPDDIMALSKPEKVKDRMVSHTSDAGILSFGGISMMSDTDLSHDPSLHESAKFTIMPVISSVNALGQYVSDSDISDEDVSETCLSMESGSTVDELKDDDLEVDEHETNVNNIESSDQVSNGDVVTEQVNALQSSLGGDVVKDTSDSLQNQLPGVVSLGKLTDKEATINETGSSPTNVTDSGVNAALVEKENEEKNGNLQAETEVLAHPNASFLPDQTKVKECGEAFARITWTSMMSKNWKPMYWVRFGDASLFVFDSKEMFENWLTNPNFTPKQRRSLVKRSICFRDEMLKYSGIRGYKLTAMKLKKYRGGFEPMYQFKIEKWTNTGVSNMAAFASESKDEIRTIRKCVRACLENCPFGGLKNISDLLKRSVLIKKTVVANPTQSSDR